jgi:alpha-mannosidase
VPSRSKMTQQPSLTAHIISHTHWDREWYRPFQEFRLSLVELVDDLLEILANDPDYRYFMLDGQAIILEDYVEVRPERQCEMRDYIQSGRLLIGPWYILPDEFLVSGEATIRNLLLGRRVCREFGSPMQVGYVPDPFGHISQLPQILRGFGIDTAVFRRGLSDEPTLLRWAAPDGTQVLAIYLRDGYDNAAWLPTDPDEFTAAARYHIQSIARHTPAGHVLLMHGTDHMHPLPDLPDLIAYANTQLDDIKLVHSTLPKYIESVRAPDNQPSNRPTNDLTIEGELRSPKRHHLLPGVLSTRMWIKQRNQAIETLLERWAEPFSTWAALLGDRNRTGQVWQAWRYLLQNHPHDSICGCSVDQVHREMETRFDWAEQIGERIAAASLTAIASRVAPPGNGRPVVVFNAAAQGRTDAVTVEMPLPAVGRRWQAVLDGQPLATQMLEKPETLVAEMTLGRVQLRALLPVVKTGRMRDWVMHDFDIRTSGSTANIDILVSRHGTPSAERLAEGQAVAHDLLERGITTFQVRLHTGRLVDVAFVARDVPGMGYRAFELQEVEAGSSGPAGDASERQPNQRLENEFFSLDVDRRAGTLAVTDKRTGVVFRGLNRLVDGGDRGDEYNYCPPEHDTSVDRPARAPQITFGGGPARHRMRLEMVYRLPSALADGRQARRSEVIDVPITTTVSLSPGVPRIDVRTTVDNRAADHRLRVHFPTPFHAQQSVAQGQFDAVERPVAVPAGGADWVEQPVGTHPHQGWVDISSANGGLMIATRGLPEYEIVPGRDGDSIAITLLRCVGWLSRDDFPCRTGQAGPYLATPGAQCPGEYTFEYSIIPHAGDWQTAFPYAQASSVPLRAVAAEQRESGLPPVGRCVAAEPSSFVITAVKMAEGGDGVIVRGYNIAPEPVHARIRFGAPAHAAWHVNLAEEEVERLETDDAGWVELEVWPKEIITLKFK